jgi:hypothetical protein
MSSPSRLAVPVAVLLLMFLAACGGGTHSPVAPPSGAFSNTILNGTYTFSLLGSDTSGSMALAGTITACGCSRGTLSAGTVDLSSSTGDLSAVGINTGASGYNITADGRGKINLALNTNPTQIVILDIVVTSGSHGLIVRFDGNGTGSGTIDAVPGAVSLSNSSYALTLSGADASGNPLLTVGAFTLDSSGTITAGIADVNDNASVSAGATLSGSVTVGAATAPGTATLVVNGTSLTFDVYAIDATDLKLIETNTTGQVLAGDAFIQTSTTVPSGTLVFSMGGATFSSSVGGFIPYAMAGTVKSDGSSTLSNGAEDINNDGTVDGGGTTATPISFTGTFAANPSGSGRYLVTLTGFQGGSQFAAYPSSGGILLLEIDTVSGGFTSGTAIAQSAAGNLAGSQGYGMNLTGTDLGSGAELDQIAEFTTSSSGLSGLLDQNDAGSTSTNNLNGHYTTSSSGVGSVTFNTGSAFYYAVDNSTLMLLANDSGEVSLGAIQLQSTPSSAQAAVGVTQRQLAMLRGVAHARSARQKGLTQSK